MEIPRARGRRRWFHSVKSVCTGSGNHAGPPRLQPLQKVVTGQVHSRVVLDRLADLVREMNCYYSNLIEGHKTAPREIERALKRDF